MHFPKGRQFFNEQVTLEDFSYHSLIVPVKTKAGKKAVVGKGGRLLREKMYTYTH